MVWQALLGGLLGGGGQSGGVGGGSGIFGTTVKGPFKKAEEQRAKFEASSQQRDALIREALLNAPTPDLQFAQLAPQTGDISPPPAEGTTKNDDGEFLNFIKGLMGPPDESDTAIPEEDPPFVRTDTQTGARKVKRAEKRDVQEKDAVQFTRELQVLFGGGLE